MLRPGKTRLRDFVNQASEAMPRLPLVHSTDCYTLDEIIDMGAMQPHIAQPSSTEPAVYLFYGKPSRRVNNDVEATNIDDYLPVVLILKDTISNVIKHICPFDSGAFGKGLFRALTYKKIQLEDFFLEPELSTPGKVITSFFGTVGRYLMAKPLEDRNFDPRNFEAGNYSNIIRAVGTNEMDSRHASIEIAAVDEVSLSAYVQAIILPIAFANSSMGDDLRQLGIKLLPYNGHDRMAPREYTTELRSICLRYYIEEGIISESDLDG